VFDVLEMVKGARTHGTAVMLSLSLSLAANFNKNPLTIIPR
jgi:hypothetical protein